MSSEEKMPQEKNIPELQGNMEGLKKHSFGCIFIPEPSPLGDDRKLRSWLLHTVASASRHYSKARELVQLQNNNGLSRDGGAVFYILDVAEEIEDCVTATYRACMAIKRISGYQQANEFSSKFEDSIKELGSLRNQFEHMHQQIIANETGNGPISVVFADEGRFIRFRKLRMETAKLHALIDGAFRVVASLHPTFDANSRKEAGGPIKLTMTASISVIESDGARREIT
jgi:hypothetical protein